MGKGLNLDGKTFNYWTVLSFSHLDERKRKVWDCICKCGTERKVIGSNLVNNMSKSCGCLQKETKGPQWTGIEEISGEFIYNIKTKAKSRNIEYNLSNEYLWELYLKQNKKCALSGVDITFAPTNEQKDSHLKTASLDRIDSSKPYIEGNVQWVHKHINIMKNVYMQDEFINYCKLVTDHQTSLEELVK